MKKRMITLLMAGAVLLSGCNNTNVSDQQFEYFFTASAQEEVPEESAREAVTELMLAYNVNDSLNPYQMTTQSNLQLVPLFYDSLVTLNKRFEPQMLIADQITMTSGECRVKVKRVQFSNGEILTPADVVYSANLAMNSSQKWGELLSDVSKVDISEEGDEIVFTLKRSNQDFASLLTFPIVQQNTGEQDYPVGVSRYYLSGMWGTTGATLIANPLYYGEKSTIKTIKLSHITDSDGLIFNMKSGDIDLIYSDLSSAKFADLTASGVPTPLTNFVYLGVNSNRGLLGKPEFRQALSTAINRDELVSKAYVARADATMHPFHPGFYRMDGIDVSVPHNLTEADALLNALGLTERDAEGFRTYNGKTITLSLLVNSENTYRNAAATLVSEQLRQIGVRVDVVSKPYAEYRQTISGNNFDLYIGEVKLKEDLDISVLLRGGSLGSSAAYDEQLIQLYSAYRQTGDGLDAFCNHFSSQTPFVPLVYRQGMSFYGRKLHRGVIATEQNIFYNIAEW